MLIAVTSSVAVSSDSVRLIPKEDKQKLNFSVVSDLSWDLFVQLLEQRSSGLRVLFTTLESMSSQLRMTSVGDIDILIIHP